MCEQCTTLQRVLADLQESERLLAGEVEQLRTDLELSERERKRILRREQHTLNQLAHEAGTSPKGQDATRILERWLDTCVSPKSRNRVNIAPGSDRHKLTMQALGKKGNTVERLLRCVDALSKATCTVKGSRLPGMRHEHHCEGGPSTRDCAMGGTRYADIEHAIGNDKRVEAMDVLADLLTVRRIAPESGEMGLLRMLEVLRQVNAGMPVPLEDRALQDRLASALDATTPARPVTRQVREPRPPEQVARVKAFQQHHFLPDSAHPSDPFDAFVREVERHGKRVRRNYNDSEVRAQCPGHDGDGLNLKITRGRDGRVLLSCKSRGCSVEDVCAALDWPVRWLFPLSEVGLQSRSDMLWRAA